MSICTKRRLVTLVLTLSLPFSSTGIANAAPHQESVAAPAAAVDHELSPAEIAQAEQNAQVLFTELLQQENGTWSVNEDAAMEEGVSTADLQALANSLNGRSADGTPRVTPYYSVNSEEYKSCVLNAVGLGAFVGAASGGGSQLGFLIATQNWREVAWVLVRLVGVNAVKSGAVGLAVTLAGAGAWCATPAAR